MLQTQTSVKTIENNKVVRRCIKPNQRMLPSYMMLHAILLYVKRFYEKFNKKLLFQDSKTFRHQTNQHIV